MPVTSVSSTSSASASEFRAPVKAHAKNDHDSDDAPGGAKGAGPSAPAQSTASAKGEPIGTTISKTA